MAEWSTIRQSINNLVGKSNQICDKEQMDYAQDLLNKCLQGLAMDIVGPGPVGDNKYTTKIDNCRNSINLESEEPPKGFTPDKEYRITNYAIHYFEEWLKSIPQKKAGFWKNLRKLFLSPSEKSFWENLRLVFVGRN